MSIINVTSKSLKNYPTSLIYTFPRRFRASSSKGLTKKIASLACNKRNTTGLRIDQFLIWCFFYATKKTQTSLFLNFFQRYLFVFFLPFLLDRKLIFIVQHFVLLGFPVDKSSQHSKLSARKWCKQRTDKRAPEKVMAWWRLWNSIITRFSRQITFWETIK